ASAIQQIGLGAQPSSAGGNGTLFTGAVNGALVPDGANSYHANAQDGANPNLIDYGGFQSPSNPSSMEATPSSGTVYEALWEVPVKGNGSDIYEGYFTFQPNGQVSFTEPTAVPEPSTYSLLA